MLFFRNIFLSILLGITGFLPLSAAQPSDPQWEEAKTINGNFKAVASQNDIEVFSAPNVIMIKVNRNVEVRIFTILGKLLSIEQFEPGIYQCQLDSHGIYIIKTEETSCKIAI